MNNPKCLIKYINNGYINIGVPIQKCRNINKEIKTNEIRNLFLNIEQKNNCSLNLINIVNEHENEIIINKIKNSALVKKLSREKIYNASLKEKIKQMELRNLTLMEQLNDKNALVQILKARSLLQRIISNIFKKNYNYFEMKNEDFRILYESYNYLKFELKDNDVTSKKLDSIYKRMAILFKDKIKTNDIEAFLERFKEENSKNNYNFNRKNDIIDNYNNIINNTVPKIYDNKRIELFNNIFPNETNKKIDDNKISTAKQYNKNLENQSLISYKLKKDDNTVLTNNNIEKNNIHENDEKINLYKLLKLKENFYLDKLEYTNNINLNDNLIRQILENSQVNNELEILNVKKEGKDELLKKINCQTISEFKFLFLLINKLINRIDKILDENEFLNETLFYEVSEELNPINNKLIKDKNDENSFEFTEQNNKDKKPNNYLLIKSFKYEDYINHSNSLYQNYIKIINKFLREKDLKKLKEETRNEIKNFLGEDKIKSDINFFSKKLRNEISFYENFKELFSFFPFIKENIINLIEQELPINEINNLEIQISQEKEENKFINIFIAKYLLIIQLRKIIGNSANILSVYEDIFQKLYQFKLKEIILKEYKNKIKNEIDINELFIQERNNVIEEYKNNINTKRNEVEIEKKKKSNKIISTENEINEYDSTIAKMKDILFEGIEDIFKDYLDFDKSIFANLKFDVLLFLYQNHYI